MGRKVMPKEVSKVMPKVVSKMMPNGMPNASREEGRSNGPTCRQRQTVHKATQQCDDPHPTPHHHHHHHNHHPPFNMISSLPIIHKFSKPLSGSVNQLTKRWTRQKSLTHPGSQSLKPGPPLGCSNPQRDSDPVERHNEH